MASKWSKKTPGVEGWHWIRFRPFPSRLVVCPCEVFIFANGTTAVHAGRWHLVEGPDHGGKGLKINGARARGVRFGPAIPIPEGY